MNRRHLLIAGSCVLAMPIGSTVAAQDAPPDEPAAALGFEVLAAASLPAHRLRGALDAVAYTVRLRPDGHVDFPAGSRPDGATLEYVVAGAVAVRNDNPLVALRDLAAGAGGTAEEVPARQEAIVAQDEAVLNRGSGATAAVRNPGHQEALVFGAGVFSRADTPPPATPTWGVSAVDASVELVGLRELKDVEGTVGVLLARWMLGPGEALPPNAGPWPGLVWAEAPFDTAGRSNPGTEPIAVLVAAFHSAD